MMIADPLTNRELEIIRLIGAGLTNPEIAAKLSLSTETVKWYNKQSYAKLGVSNRTQAVAAARERGLLDGNGETRTQAAPYPWQYLPAELSTFVGRERETAQVKALLETARLVTLTGPGGVGKTRLAVHAAARIATQFAHGVTFVSLASTIDPSLVPGTIAARLGVVEKPDRPLMELIRYFLADKELLLVLDNFEHVIGAAPLVADLLTAGPRITILATSREVLRLSGEHEYRVPPLSVPSTRPDISPADLAGSEAVDLFVQRARSVQHGFQLTAVNAQDVAAICLRLDGLPLAIELAAARIKLFAPQQLLKRLAKRLGVLAAGPRDLPARQRTLRDTIEWSYNLLEREEQQLFARLAVFVDGRTLEAIEVICDAGLAIDTLDSLASLLNKSLIYQEEGPNGQPRFYMLEIMQEYALERLAASGEMQEMRNRHLDYFLALAESMAPGFRRQEQLLFLDQTKAEMGNLRAAFAWALAANRVDAAARLVSALDYFWIYRESLLPGYRLSVRVYARIDEVSLPYRARFLLAAGRLADRTQHMVQSRQMIEQGIAVARQQEDQRNLAWLLTELAFIIWGESRTPEAYRKYVSYTQEAIHIFRELEDQPGLAAALNGLGELLRENGEYEEAREVYEESLSLAYETGEIYRQTMAMANLAFTTYRLGDYEQAREYALRYLTQRYENGMHHWYSCCVSVLAGPECKLGSPERAARLLGASEAMLQTMKYSYQPSDQAEIELYEAEVRSALGPEAFEVYWAEGLKMSIDEAFAYVMEE